MNLVIATIASAARNSEGLIFTEQVICANHFKELPDNAVYPIGKTNEFCSVCAEQDRETMQRIRSENWYSRISCNNRVYISGQMSGLPNHNKEAFWKLEHALKKSGCQVLSPAHHNTVKTYEEYMKASIEMVFQCDCVVMMANYLHSSGALAELALASALGKTIFYCRTL